MAGKYLSWDVVINRIRLGGLICSLQKFLTIEHLPRITDFCSCVYVFGCRLSLVRFCDSEIRITPVDDITIGVHLCCLLLPHSTYFIRQFLVLGLFVGYCFGEIMCI